MKRVFAIFFAVFILAALLIMPVAASAANSAATTAVIANNKLQRLASLSVTCQLGDITLYLPYGLDAGAVLLEGDALLNMTDSTVYLYCPEFPDYVFSASRFGAFSYRDSQASSYQTVQLIVSDSHTLSDSVESVLVCIVVVYLMLSVLVSFWRLARGF